MVGEISARNFGLLIAYLLPGFLVLCGLAAVVPAVRVWLTGSPGPTIGGFFYLTLASVAAGMTASVVRWAVLDSLHAWTGLRQPQWDDSFLARRLSAFDYLVENHYRYYQFYGNSAVALVFAYASWRCSDGSAGVPAGLIEAALVFLEVVFIAGSRDALRKYFQRSSALLGVEESEKFNDQRESSLSGRERGNSEEERAKEGTGHSRQEAP